MHDENSFITLTYAPEHLPPFGTLVKKHFQDFMKRLRKSVSPKRIRFFHCGEYGDANARPHYHALIFGHDFQDKKPWKKSHDGSQLFTSKILEDLWGFGHCSIGTVTFESAAYVARYVMKKVNGDEAEYYYTVLDRDSGELVPIQPEYITCSNRPGIGQAWFDKYQADVFPDDFVVVEGRKIKVPRYYDKLLRRKEADELQRLKKLRLKKSINRKNIWNNRPDRLAVREEVTKARTNLSTRNVDHDA